MTEEEKKQLTKDITARVEKDYNGWYIIGIYYKGELIKTIEQ